MRCVKSSLQTLILRRDAQSKWILHRHKLYILNQSSPVQKNNYLPAVKQSSAVYQHSYLPPASQIVQNRDMVNTRSERNIPGGSTSLYKLSLKPEWTAVIPRIKLSQVTILKPQRPIMAENSSYGTIAIYVLHAYRIQ